MRLSNTQWRNITTSLLTFIVIHTAYLKSENGKLERQVSTLEWELHHTHTLAEKLESKSRVIDELVTEQFDLLQQDIAKIDQPTEPDYSQGISQSLMDLHERMTGLEASLWEISDLQASLPTMMPSDGLVSSPFGMRTSPFTRIPTLHRGIDIRGEIGDTIRSTAKGKVIFADDTETYGKLVVISHGDGIFTRYAHASKIITKRGRLVKKGQKIAEIGSTGLSTGAHLHYELIIQGIERNPLDYLSPHHQAQFELLPSHRIGGN